MGLLPLLPQTSLMLRDLIQLPSKSLIIDIINDLIQIKKFNLEFKG